MDDTQHASGVKAPRGRTTLSILKHTKGGYPCYLCALPTAVIAKNSRWLIPVCARCLQYHGLFKEYDKQAPEPSIDFKGLGDDDGADALPSQFD